MGKSKIQKMDVPALYEAVDAREFHWLLTPNTISMDKGNGKSSFWRLVNGKLQHFMIPNGRVRVTGYKLSSAVTSIGAHEVVYADFLNNRYGIGDGVWEQTEYSVETFIHSEMQYGSPYHIFMVLATLALGNVETDTPLRLVISAPPGMVNSVAKAIKANFMAGESGLKDGTWTIKLGHEKAERVYQFEKVVVIPEGAGTFGAYAFDANGNNAPVLHPDNGHDLLAGNVMISDGGLGTYDQYIIQRGNLKPETIQHATDHNFGIAALIINPVRDYLRSAFEEDGRPAPTLSDPQIDAWLRHWAGKQRMEDAQVTIEGVPMNLHGLFVNVIDRAGELVIAQKLEPAFRRSRVDTVLLTGGLFVYIGGQVRDVYSNRNVLLPNMVAHLHGIPLWDLNAYGGLAIAANIARISSRVNG